MHLILGTAQLTRPYGILRDASPTRDSPHSVLHAAKDSGFTGLDTAPIYGDAERVIGGANLGIALHTKIDPELDGVASVLRSKERLGVQKLDVVYQHEAFDGSKQQLEALRRIRGEVGEFVLDLGASIYTRREFELAVAAEVVSAIQIPLNVATSHFDPDDFLTAQSEGKKVFARSVFLQGVLTATPSKLPSALESLRILVSTFQNLARRWDMTPAHAALAYVKAQRGLCGIVVGANTVANVKEISDGFAISANEAFLEECQNLPRTNAFETDPRNWPHV